MPFQTQITSQPAPGLPGDFASLNPTASFPAGEGALVAATGGCLIGAFGWVQGDGRSVANAPVSSASTSAPPDGFVHRDLTAQIINLPDEGSLLIPEGYPVTLLTAGDFWAVTITAATPGQAVFASITNGSIATAAAGATLSGAVQTRFYVTSTCAAGELVKISSWSHAV
ncbi:hypothetical protein OQ252_12235 [Acetobacter farinalis]|uniref:Uncharacterized protein n=1 Tax=Acetobacter farinalis TaxID=1260984 RepID=A0ABT3QA50_9PROT|nr:hypothetical protein [Acetobacter farinalis]MCX2562159.1 hypothetical protein [Acetobacter farinalis]NHO30711.1 hypothetical protein [Acetobacter farinalis]